jgi:hypothetical protein
VTAVSSWADCLLDLQIISYNTEIQCIRQGFDIQNLLLISANFFSSANIQIIIVL